MMSGLYLLARVGGGKWKEGAFVLKRMQSQRAPFPRYFQGVCVRVCVHYALKLPILVKVLLKPASLDYGVEKNPTHNLRLLMS